MGCDICACDPLEENITVMIEPFTICKYASQWVEIEWTIQSLQRHRPGVGNKVGAYIRGRPLPIIPTYRSQDTHLVLAG